MTGFKIRKLSKCVSSVLTRQTRILLNPTLTRNGLFLTWSGNPPLKRITVTLLEPFNLIQELCNTRLESEKTKANLQATNHMRGSNSHSRTCSRGLFQNRNEKQTTATTNPESTKLFNETSGSGREPDYCIQNTLNRIHSLRSENIRRIAASFYEKNIPLETIHQQTSPRRKPTLFMQPVVGSKSETKLSDELVTAGMEGDGQQHLQLGIAASPGVCIGPSADEGRLISHLKVDTRELLDAEIKNAQKEKRKKKKTRTKTKKKKLKPTAACLDNLLAELPFANPEIKEEFGIITSEKSLKKKRKRTLAAESEDDAGKKKKPQRPNYFVSIPVTNPKILTGIEAIQDAIIQKDHRFSKAMIPAGTLHITLLVTYLGNEEVNMAVCAMTEMKDTLLDMLQGKELVLPFHGIGHFRSEVAFVQMAEGEHVIALTKIAETVKKSFEEKGILVTDSKAFKPHLTFMKLSRAPKLRSQGIKKLDPKLYENFEHHNFGEETVARLDLCSMQKKKQPNGYYHCEASIDFGEKHVAEPDDAELVSLSKRLVESAVLKAVQQYLEETQLNKHRGKA
ncbi:A-kinase anchor protein 7-like isoform X2 [Acipenser ruthenus]|uniref:A-kinase anchor protein 7-like isoform X2 n=1 Tax=Acipenser ruthenus TaxID=7906 RepID=UPI00274179A3|nr:A-kinase anchor protein 7-like isoform X2 [Acipenser ruthenus]